MRERSEELYIAWSLQVGESGNSCKIRAEHGRTWAEHGRKPMGSENEHGGHPILKQQFSGPEVCPSWGDKSHVMVYWSTGPAPEIRQLNLRWTVDSGGHWHRPRPGGPRLGTLSSRQRAKNLGCLGLVQPDWNKMISLPLSFTKI